MNVESTYFWNFNLVEHLPSCQFFTNTFNNWKTLLFYFKIYCTAGYPVNCVDGVELGVGPIVGEVNQDILQASAG